MDPYYSSDGTATIKRREQQYPPGHRGGWGYSKKWSYYVQLGDGNQWVAIGTSLAEAKSWAKQRGAKKISYAWEQSNPIAPSTTELIVGGAASVVLIGLGITMAYKALAQTADTTTTLQNTAALTALATVV